MRNVGELIHLLVRNRYASNDTSIPISNILIIPKTIYFKNQISV